MVFDGSTPGPGRPKGLPNRITQKMREWSEQYGQQWVEEVWKIALTADKMSDRLMALNLLGKKALPDLKAIEITGELDTNPRSAIDLTKLTAEELQVVKKIMTGQQNNP